MEEDRFEVFPDPLNNWIVWDLHEDTVAEVGSQLLRCLSEARARAFCSLLNKLQFKRYCGGPPIAEALRFEYRPIFVSDKACMKNKHSTIHCRSGSSG
jgi:hypothetical protein